jgi:hypothetical protein
MQANEGGKQPMDQWVASVYLWIWLMMPQTVKQALQCCLYACQGKMNLKSLTNGEIKMLKKAGYDIHYLKVVKCLKI